MAERGASRGSEGSLVMGPDNGSLGRLPWDVLVRLVGFLPRPLSALPFLNSFYKDLAYNPQSWTTLDFSHSELGDPHLKLAAEHPVARHCTSLLLTSASELEESTFLLFLEATGERLGRLELGFMDDVAGPVLTKIGELCPNLTSLNLEGTSVNDSVLNSIGRNLPKLKELNLCNSYGVTVRGAKQLATLAELESLNLDGCPGASTEAIQDLAKNLHKIEVFHLDGEESCGLALLHAGNAWGRTLSQLHVNFCNDWDPHHADEGLLALRGCHSLTVLKLLKGKCFSTEALMGFAREPRLRRGMVELGLTECENLTDDVVVLLGQQCPDLQVVNLEWSSTISDRGLGGLSGCLDLRSINLTGLKSIEGATLEAAMGGMPNLERVVLKSCNRVPEERWANMCRQVAHCIVEDYWGSRYVFDGQEVAKLPQYD